MNKYTYDSNKYSGGGVCVIDEKRKETGESFKEIIDQYYDESIVPDKMEQEINEAVASFENTEFKDRCMKELAGRQKNIWRIGRICLSRAAAIAIIICLSTLSSVLVYAYVSGHIKSIKVNDYEDHGEVEFDLNEDMQALTEIEEYKDPVWIPDGYYEFSKNKGSLASHIVYKNNKELLLGYTQSLPIVNIYYSTEYGVHENVSFDIYHGEYIETKDVNYLIVTDGTYLYSISGYIDKEAMIKMINKK